MIKLKQLTTELSEDEGDTLDDEGDTLDDEGDTDCSSVIVDLVVVIISQPLPVYPG